MLHDAGSWHWSFNELVAKLRQEVLRIAGLAEDKTFETIFMQGSGTFGVEAVLSSAIPKDGKLLTLANGAYGERISKMAAHLGIPEVKVTFNETSPVDAQEVRDVLQKNPGITHAALVHCETTTGIVNPITDVGKVLQEFRVSYILDAVSSFGALEIPMQEAGVDYLITSPNKCLESVPGFSIVLARTEKLLANKNQARSLSLDLVGQLQGFFKNGQFRFTPPTHSILAFAQAIEEFKMEGGIAGRAGRYRKNHETLMTGMSRLGFRSLLSKAVQSFIITSFSYPPSPFNFADFYKRLAEAGFIIYPGKLTNTDSFRIGTIGRIFPPDIQQLLGAIERALLDAGLTLPLK